MSLKKRKKKTRLTAKDVLMLGFFAFITVSTIYHVHIARAMMAQAATATTSTTQEIGRWVNSDGTPCDKQGDAWVCTMPTPDKKAQANKTRPTSEVKTVTAYNSVKEQTDSTPCIAAYGDNICALEKKGDHSCAAAYPYGTKLTVPGKGTCTVRDVLAPKYAHRVDWYEGGADKIASALKFGKQSLQVAIVYED
jgi:3D (Asp-Asp-Asp) domain-containing protein